MLKEFGHPAVHSGRIPARMPCHASIHRGYSLGQRRYLTGVRVIHLDQSPSKYRKVIFFKFFNLLGRGSKDFLSLPLPSLNILFLAFQHVFIFDNWKLKTILLFLLIPFHLKGEKFSGFVPPHMRRRRSRRKRKKNYVFVGTNFPDGC